MDKFYLSKYLLDITNNCSNHVTRRWAYERKDFTIASSVLIRGVLPVNTTFVHHIARASLAILAMLLGFTYTPSVIM
jgi:hypothetical protein